MLFMVIERFKNRNAQAVYSRLKEKDSLWQAFLGAIWSEGKNQCK